jgi:hypothetical protein
MPSRKQRRREAKAKRHEYEFVYLDAEGNELDDVPEELEPKREREERRNGSKPAAATKSQPQPRGRREPPVPSWNRAFKRGALLGLVVFVLFSLTAKGNYVGVIPLAVLYTALFIPFTFVIDRFAYRRWQARQGVQSTGAAKKPAAKKR